MLVYDKLDITAEGYLSYTGLDEEGIMIEGTNDDLIPDLLHCTYCSQKLLKVQAEEIDDGQLVRDNCLWYCRNCRFWQCRLYYDPYAGCMPGPLNQAFVSKLREFDEQLPASCNAELASFIRRNPNVLHTYDPRRFEKVVTDIFRANFTNAEVLHVGKPDDGGIDILLIDSGAHQWLIQVKRRENARTSEGVSTIRNLLGTMVLNEALHGIVVSTANQFSLRAKQAANVAGQIGFQIKLVDKGILNKMLDPILPDRPWLKPILGADTEFARYLGERLGSDSQLSLFDLQPFTSQVR